ncbi:MAG: Ribose import ATP-binding protein RbsA [Firmicutes bacterium ADurb.Bin182]|nr:MAG: Ribose import ATP-binding protein RbsA [Firmicutes bacterium ADurb.Bin182]
MVRSQTLQNKEQPLLTLRGITRAFPGVVANDHIDLDIYAGEIHALLGENGAGKSVLMKILYGFYHADSGEILINGMPVSIQSPHDARNLHIGMVFQNHNMIPVLSVWENIALFLPDLKFVVDAKNVERRIIEISDRYNLKVNPSKLISQISIGEQQKVEILKLLLSDARVLILDEPTHVLAPHEVEAFFKVLDSLRKDGYAIILITHKMKDVLECADRISVLRGGRLAGTMLREEATEDKLINLMFEKVVPGLIVGTEETRKEAPEPFLELQEISTDTRGMGRGLKDVSLKIYPGEIVGIAGVSGNGQKELCDVILGIEPSSKGKKLLAGKDLTNRSIGIMRKNKVAFIPENALSMATIPYLTVLKNMVLTKTRRYSRHGGFSMDWQAARADIENAEKRLGFSVPLNVIAKTLSGGNLQRMIILRELESNPQLIIAAYFTRGLDVQSTIAARQALVQAREKRAAILLVSEDLDELFTVSDRLAVLFDGKIVGEFKPKDTNMYEIGHLMTGSGVHTDAEN